jgi:flagellar motor component MotA
MNPQGIPALKLRIKNQVFTIIGYAVAFNAVIGGFALKGGPVAVLNQTVEFLIIGRPAIASILAGKPRKVTAALILGRLHGTLQHAA